MDNLTPLNPQEPNPPKGSFFEQTTPGAPHAGVPSTIESRYFGHSCSVEVAREQSPGVGQDKHPGWEKKVYHLNLWIRGFVLGINIGRSN